MGWTQRDNVFSKEWKRAAGLGKEPPKHPGLGVLSFIAPLESTPFLGLVSLMLRSDDVRVRRAISCLPLQTGCSLRADLHVAFSALGLAGLASEQSMVSSAELSLSLLRVPEFTSVGLPNKFEPFILPSLPHPTPPQHLIVLELLRGQEAPSPKSHYNVNGGFSRFPCPDVLRKQIHTLKWKMSVEPSYFMCRNIQLWGLHFSSPSWHLGPS